MKGKEDMKNISCCGEFTLAGCQLFSHSFSSTGQAGKISQESLSVEIEGDHLPATIMGKTDLIWEKFNLLPVSNRVGW